jgi:hypothetical protein
VRVVTRSSIVLILCAALALVGIAGALLILIQTDDVSQEERVALDRQVQVLGALTCEMAVRLREGHAPTLKEDFDNTGVVAITPICQGFVGILDEDIIFTGEQVERVP